MFVLSITFPAHRYHATPWGNHVNEGLVEWPPSPWRIVRAFYSVGHTHLAWDGEIPTAFSEIVDAMASTPPSYALPANVETHTRHYMPVPGTTAKVIDTCKRFVDAAPLLVRFDAELSPEAYSLLKELASNVGYLGRAESWVDVDVLDKAPSQRSWSLPNDDGTPSLGKSSSRVLIPLVQRDYQEWREREIQDKLQRVSNDVERPPTKSERKQASAPFPESIVDCLAIDTNFLRKHGWSQPPGTRWQEYLLEVSDKPVSLPSRVARHQGGKDLPTTAILSLSIESVSGTTLPPIGRTLFVAEALHGAAIDRYTDRHDSLCYALSGRTPKGQPNTHRHVHFLPMDFDGDKKLDHVLVHCPSGLDYDTQHSIASIGRIYSQNLPATFVTWVGCGDVSLARDHIRRTEGNVPRYLRPSKNFRSLTPYVASRHLRRKYQLLQNIEDECRFRNLPLPIALNVISPNAGKFRLARIEDKRRPPVAQGQFISIEFDSIVDAPLTLGYGSHFGLGLFAADDP
ncbi:MAG: type I-U CRISPR-associated protein Csb2 [Pirellulaceae bacterium]